jgi:FkbM family methyltransferase
MAHLIAWRDQCAKPTTNEELAFFAFCLHNIAHTKAQLLQDLWVAYELKSQRSGFFVEFGAADGVYLSNTFYLEKTLGWRGILAEPSRCFYPAIRQARACVVDPRCLWTVSEREVPFNQTADPHLSTLDFLTDADLHAPDRQDGTRYMVPTVSLNDLLAQHQAPRRIDYLSVDTEGSEMAILGAFDFDRYDIRLITVEHKATPAREGLHQLLTAKGFRRKFESFSRWDSWYVKA